MSWLFPFTSARPVPPEAIPPSVSATNVPDQLAWARARAAWLEQHPGDSPQLSMDASTALLSAWVEHVGIPLVGRLWKDVPWSWTGAAWSGFKNASFDPTLPALDLTVPVSAADASPANERWNPFVKAAVVERLAVLLRDRVLLCDAALTPQGRLEALQRAVDTWCADSTPHPNGPLALLSTDRWPAHHATRAAIEQHNRAAAAVRARATDLEAVRRPARDALLNARAHLCDVLRVRSVALASWPSVAEVADCLAGRLDAARAVEAPPPSSGPAAAPSAARR